MKVEVDELLAVDVDAEIRKIVTARHRGIWEVVIELVRRGLRDGARDVNVAVTRTGLVVEDDGSPIDPATLADLAALFDADRDRERRHQALVALEAAGERGLTALLGLGARHVEIRTGGTKLWLSRTVVGRSEVPDGPTRVVIRGCKVEPKRTRRKIEAACAYSAARVRVDGRVVPSGFDAALATASLERPLRAQVAIQPEGEQGRLRLLQHGVVSAHAAVVQPPWFDAAIELGEMSDVGATGADLREVMASHLEWVEDAATQLALVQAESFAALTPSVRRRIRQLVLQAGARGLRAGQVEGARIFEGVTEGGGYVLGSLDDLGSGGPPGSAFMR